MTSVAARSATRCATTRTAATVLLAAAAALALATGAQAQTIVPAQSEISFVSKQMGVPVDGRFKQWTAQIAFDPKKPEAGKVGFTIQTGTSIGSPARMPRT
jgi:polyisoprenoid-binding protein YceI